jgi:hypothetical protein
MTTASPETTPPVPAEVPKAERIAADRRRLAELYPAAFAPPGSPAPRRPLMIGALEAILARGAAAADGLPFSRTRLRDALEPEGTRSATSGVAPVTTARPRCASRCARPAPRLDQVMGVAPALASAWADVAAALAALLSAGVDGVPFSLSPGARCCGGRIVGRPGAGRVAAGALALVRSLSPSPGRVGVDGNVDPGREAGAARADGGEGNVILTESLTRWSPR